MQAVSTTACCRIVDRQVQVVATEEPVKGAPRFLVPPLIAGKAMRFEAGRDHGLRLHRLLIEARTLTAALIKTVGTDRHKMTAVRVGSLQIRQPLKRFQSGVGHFIVGYALAAYE